jgi:hypothetical protein
MLHPIRIKAESAPTLGFPGPTVYVVREHNARGGSVLLALAATATSDGGNEPDLLAFVVAFAPLIILVPLSFFAIRWQVRLFKDVQYSLQRIADAVENIARRRTE